MSRTDHEKRKKFRESIGRKSLAPGNLQEQAILYASWPTPSAQGSAGEISEDLERKGEKWVNKKTGRVLQTNLATDVKMLTAWPTPATRDYRHANAKPWAERGGGKKGEQLNNAVVHQAAWPTPIQSDSHPKGYCGPSLDRREKLGKSISLAMKVQGTSGEMPNGSPAGTGSGGQLNPAFVLWLMGYPPEWESCAPPAMPSSRNSGRSSSEPA